MSKKDPKTRFVCQLRHQRSELLSVAERPSGGLLISLKAAENFTPDETLYPAQKRISDQHYSVHRSNAGADTTIHHTITLEDGDKLDTSSFLPASSGNLLWPIFVRACPYLGEPRYASQPRPKDHSIVAAQMEGRESTLVYSVIVSSRALNFPHSISVPPPFARFKYFDVTMLCMYLWVPPLPQGTLHHQATNLPRVNGTFVIGDISQSMPPIGPVTQQALHQIVDAAFEQVRVRHMKKVRAALPPEHHAQLDALPTAGFFATPPSRKQTSSSAVAAR